MRRLLPWCLAWLVVPTHACDGLVASGGWLREPAPGMTTAAAYVTLTNRGTAAVRITGVSSPDFEHAMLHETHYVDGIAHMHHQAAIELAPGASYHARPGAAHIMLEHPHRALGSDMSVRLRFICAAGEPLEVEVPVRKQAPE